MLSHVQLWLVFSVVQGKVMGRTISEVRAVDLRWEGFAWKTLKKNLQYPIKARKKLSSVSCIFSDFRLEKQPLVYQWGKHLALTKPSTPQKSNGPPPTSFFRRQLRPEHFLQLMPKVGLLCYHLPSFTLTHRSSLAIFFAQNERKLRIHLFEKVQPFHS